MLFIDKFDRKWEFQITLATARAIDNSDFSSVSNLEFAFIDGDKEFFQEVLTNTQFSVALVWAIICNTYGHDNIKELLKQPTLEDAELAFISGIDGRTLKDLKKALFEALVDFFQDRATVLSVVQKKLEKAQMMLNLEIQEMDQILDKKLEQEVKAARKHAEDELGLA